MTGISESDGSPFDNQAFFTRGGERTQYMQENGSRKTIPRGCG